MKMVSHQIEVFSNNEKLLFFSIAPTGPPTEVFANATSSRSLSLSWSPPIQELRNGIIRNYFISVTSGANTITRNISSVQTMIYIAGLQPYTTYNCTIQAGTIQLGPSSSVFTVNTPQDGKNRRENNWHI